MSAATDRDRTLKLARRRQGVTTRDLAEAGIHTQVLSRLVAAGEIERIARGMYRLPDHAFTEHHGLAIAAAAVPNAVVCLLSALQFHRIGTQLPSEVWIAIDRRARRPAVRYPPLRIVRYTGAALTEGIETPSDRGPGTFACTASPRRSRTASSTATRSVSTWRWRRCGRRGGHAGSPWTTSTAMPQSAAFERVMRPYLEALAA